MHDESLNDGAMSDSEKSNEVMEKLGAYVDGELSPVDRETIEALLERDKSCREIVQSFRFLDEAARLETVPLVNAAEWARIWEALQRQKDLPLTAAAASSEVSEAASPEVAGAENAHGGKIIHGRWLYRLAAVAAVIALAIVGLRMMQPSDTANEIVRPQPPSPSSEPSSFELSSSEEELDNSESDEDGEDSIGIGVISGVAPDEIREDGVIYRDF